MSEDCIRGKQGSYTRHSSGMKCRLLQGLWRNQPVVAAAVINVPLYTCDEACQVDSVMRGIHAVGCVPEPVNARS